MEWHTTSLEIFFNNLMGNVWYWMDNDYAKS